MWLGQYNLSKVSGDQTQVNEPINHRLYDTQKLPSACRI